MNVRFLPVCAILLCAVLGHAGDFKIGPDVSLDGLSIVSGNQSYTVVWRDLRNTQAMPQIRGLTVSTAGTVSPDFPISDSSGLPLPNPVQRNTVAFDGTNFLAIWPDVRAGGAGIRGALFSPQGTVIGGADFLIASMPALTSNGNLAPQVVFSGTDYFVAWQNPFQGSNDINSQIGYTRVSTLGNVGNSLVLPDIDPLGPLQSLEFLVTGLNSEVLVVFQDLASSPNLTRATRIAADNSITGPQGGTFLFKQDFSPSGFGVPIGAAFVSTEYAILSSYSTQITSTVFKTRLRADGSVVLPSGPFAIVGQGVTDLAENAFPRTFYNGNSEFLFVRNVEVSNIAYHLFTKRVAIDGTDRDANPPFIDSAPQGVLNGAMAAAGGGQYFVAWMDGRRLPGQPERQTNIYGVLIDGTQPGDPTHPLVRAVAHASPIEGNSPLKVTFGSAQSTGIIDVVNWDFGDGSTSDKLFPPVHTYTTSGLYMAVLSLVRTGIWMRDFVQISVDGIILGGAGGPAQSIGGTLGPVSNTVDTDIFVTSMGASLDFKTPNTDALHFGAFIDPTVLRVALNGAQGSLNIGANAYSFTLNSNATFASVGVTPKINVSVNPFTGAVQLNTSGDSLQTVLALFGAGDETDAKPGKTVVVPFSFTFDALSLNSTVQAIYTAKTGKSGQLEYLFNSKGQPGLGFLHIVGAKAAESNKKSTDKTHTFAIAGYMGMGNGQQLTKADIGNWNITLGNFAQAIPVSAFKVNGNIYTFSAKGGSAGISIFKYNLKTQGFELDYKLLPADGDNPSGMALASSTISRADMALSFDLDLTAGGKYQASRYVRLVRTKAGKGTWTLR